MARGKNSTLKITKTTNKVKASSSTTEEKKSTKRKFRKGTVALREIRKYQKTTDLLLRKVRIEKERDRQNIFCCCLRWFITFCFFFIFLFVASIPTSCS